MTRDNSRRCAARKWRDLKEIPESDGESTQDQQKRLSVGVAESAIRNLNRQSAISIRNLNRQSAISIANPQS